MSLFLGGDQRRSILFPVSRLRNTRKKRDVFPDGSRFQRERLSRMRSYVPRLMIFVIDTASVRLRRISSKRGKRTFCNFSPICGKRILFIWKIFPSDHYVTDIKMASFLNGISCRTTKLAEGNKRDTRISIK